MKTKTTLLLAFATFLTFASCKKDYTCTCTYKYSSTSSLQSSSQVYEESFRSDAKTACDQKDADLLNSGYVDVECKLN